MKPTSLRTGMITETNGRSVARLPTSRAARDVAPGVSGAVAADVLLFEFT